MDSKWNRNWDFGPQAGNFLAIDIKDHTEKGLNCSYAVTGMEEICFHLKNNNYEHY